MKVSIKQLEMVLSKLRYSLIGYSNSEKNDLTVDIDITKEDPGSGIMTDCLMLKAEKPTGEDAEGGIRMEIEVYLESENIDPRASKIESFKVTGKY